MYENIADAYVLTQVKVGKGDVVTRKGVSQALVMQLEGTRNGATATFNYVVQPDNIEELLRVVLSSAREYFPDDIPSSM